MSDPIVSFAIDLTLFLRLFGGFLWGFLWAAILQWTRKGKFLAEERTWLTVVIGIGVDLIIAYPANWWVIAGVIVCSSVGIIWRSLHNELHQPPKFNRNKMIWGVEDGIAQAATVIDRLQNVLAAGTVPAADASQISRALGELDKLREGLRLARAGEYKVQKK
ncbi:MAG: hypothetical protein AAF485_27510 [Chloroflexota bacterium]